MRYLDNKLKRITAIIIVVSLFLTILPASLTGGMFKDRTKPVVRNMDDRKTASDISNMIGAKLEEVLRLRNEGRSWNEVLQRLKTNSSDNRSEREDRSKLLTRGFLDEEFITKLKKEGFEVKEIDTARMMAERTAFQLQEVAAGGENLSVQAPEVVVGTEEKEKDDIKVYLELNGKFDVKTAVYLILKLKGKYGSMENVLNEYLYSLQAGLDLEECVLDSKAYEKKKKEKAQETDQNKILTLEKIEQKMLEKLQKQSNEKSQEDTGSSASTVGKDSNKSEEDYLPEIPKPEEDGLKPANPAEALKNEIKSLDPMQ